MKNDSEKLAKLGLNEALREKELVNFVKGNINSFQHNVNIAKKQINLMKEKLGKAGYEVKLLSKDLVDKKRYICFVRPKEGKQEKKEIRTEAICAEQDYNIPILGKYLALARATEIILGDNNVKH